VRFEWDPGKAASNKRKPGVGFEEAASTFEDEHAWFYPDLANAERFVLIGLSHLRRLVFTIHAELAGDTIRLISVKKTTNTRGPARASLIAAPEIDFGKYGRRRRNPFAKRMAKEGWELAHSAPSSASLRDMPELRGPTKGRPNPYAKRIASQGVELQVGRGRPRVGAEIGPTQVKSVRLPPLVWKQLEEQARAEGLALHALLRAAILDWLKRRSLA
jgi:uncharacterized DUF497 family protein